MRALALGVIAQSGNKKMLSMVAESGWKAEDTETDKDAENWFGSVALLEGAARSVIAHEEVLDRISSQLYGQAAAMLDEKSVHVIARRIDGLISRVIDLDSDLVAPDIEIQVHPSNPCEPSLPRLSERPSENKDIIDVLNRRSESSEDFEHSQRRSYEAFLNFKSYLTEEKALIILHSINLKDFAKIFESAENFADRWYELFMNLADAKLPAVYNLVLLLAHALMRKAPNKAKELFRLVENSNPLVCFTFSGAGVQLDAIATWAGIQNPILDELRLKRLVRASCYNILSLPFFEICYNRMDEIWKNLC